jgi:phage N-6-adenine-methyltransferase
MDELTPRLATAITVRPTVTDADAFEIGRVYGLAKSSLIDSVKYQIQCGQMLIAKKATMAHGQWLLWLKANKDELGFNVSSTPQRLMKLANSEYSALTQNIDEATATQISREVWGNSKVLNLLSSESAEWYTPARIIEAARDALGAIDLDPASCDEANKVVRAARIFTKEDNGLEQEWHGRVWMNPPYCGLAGDFVTKLMDEYDAGRVTAAVVLLNANGLSTQYFGRLFDSVLCFPSTRIDFYGPNGAGEGGAATHGSVLVYLGADPAAFVIAFQPIGYVLVRATAETVSAALKRPTPDITDDTDSDADLLPQAVPQIRAVSR